MQKLRHSIADGITGGIVLAAIVGVFVAITRYPDAALTLVCGAFAGAAVVSTVSLLYHHRWEHDSR